VAQSRQVAGAAERKPRARSRSIKTAYPSAFSQESPCPGMSRTFDRDRAEPPSGQFHASITTDRPSTPTPTTMAAGALTAATPSECTRRSLPRPPSTATRRPRPQHRAIQGSCPPPEMRRNQPGASTEPCKPVPNGLRRSPETLSDPSIPRAARGQHRRAHHLDRVTTPQQTHIRQQHMRCGACPLPTTPPPGPQPPKTVPGPQRAPTRAPPATQNPEPAPRAHQPARGEIRLQASTILCDDEQDRPSFRRITGPLATPRQRPTRGPNDNMTIDIMSPATPPDENHHHPACR
jgi:hypothetical protein